MEKAAAPNIIAGNSSGPILLCGKISMDNYFETMSDEPLTRLLPGFGRSSLSSGISSRGGMVNEDWEMMFTSIEALEKKGVTRTQSSSRRLEEGR